MDKGEQEQLRASLRANGEGSAMQAAGARGDQGGD
jgi:hypothetical protein